MSPYLNIQKELIVEKLKKWCNVILRFNNYVIVKLERPEMVFGVGNIDINYALECIGNDIYFYVYKNQIHYANKQITTSKSEAMEEKLRELGYTIEPNIGYAQELSKTEVTKGIINPHKLFEIKLLIPPIKSVE